ncbi:MAG TPA: hypothetical protein VF041_22385 [Gemmatimonadaceae bacterium]
MPLELPRPSAAVLVALVVVALLGAIFARVAGARAGSPPAAAFPYLSSEALRYDRVNAAGHERREILLLGSSLVRHGFIEEQLERDLADSSLRVFNAGLDGAGMWATLRLLRRMDPPRPRGPNVAILEVNRKEMRTGREPDPWGEAQLARRGLAPDGRAPASALLVRARRAWAVHPPRQTLEGWVEELRLGWLAEHVPGVVSTPEPQPRALWTASAIARRRAVRDMLPEIEARRLEHWRLDEGEVIALREVVAELHHRGYRVVLFVAPMHSRYRSTVRAYPDFVNTERRFQAMLHDPAIGADRVLEIPDARALGESDSIFVDYGHLTRHGASVQTRWVAGWLARNGIS